jgi:hypothetical protein
MLIPGAHKTDRQIGDFISLLSFLESRLRKEVQVFISWWSLPSRSEVVYNFHARVRTNSGTKASDVSRTSLALLPQNTTELFTLYRRRATSIHRLEADYISNDLAPSVCHFKRSSTY